MENGHATFPRPQGDVGTGRDRGAPCGDLPVELTAWGNGAERRLPIPCPVCWHGQSGAAAEPGVGSGDGLPRQQRREAGWQWFLGLFLGFLSCKKLAFVSSYLFYAFGVFCIVP